MTNITGLPAVASSDAKILILGSIPGTASLQVEQYYAHPRNQFWPILCSLLAISPESPYQARVETLTNAGIALWDVVKTCQRPGSMDANINRQTIVANDISALLQTCPRIGQIFFNGSTAEQTFRKYVLGSIPERKLSYRKLPSTSPAYASMTFEQKLHEWRILTQNTVKIRHAEF